MTFCYLLGGHGRVYSVAFEGNTAALKLTAVNSSNGAANFAREITALRYFFEAFYRILRLTFLLLYSQLRSEYIVEAIGVVTSVERNGFLKFGILMEWCEETFEDAFRKNLPHWNAIVIIADVACGLEVLHSIGLIHRDVKPANVLVSMIVMTSVPVFIFS